MGTWGTGSFDNDTAADFCFTVRDQGKKQLLEALKAVVDAPNEDYLEAPECCEALVAIEFVVASMGQPSKAMAPENVHWAKSHKLKTIKTGVLSKSWEMKPLAQQAIARILYNSELQELWEETEDYQAWIDDVKGLEVRLITV